MQVLFSGVPAKRDPVRGYTFPGDGAHIHLPRYPHSRTRLVALHCNGHACSRARRESLTCLIAHPRHQPWVMPKSAGQIPPRIAFWPENHTTSPHCAPQEHHLLHTASLRYISTAVCSSRQPRNACQTDQSENSGSRPAAIVICHLLTITQSPQCSSALTTHIK